MIQTFLATLNPMLTLFICIVLGFLLTKLNILPENASKVMAKLETYAFCPALSFYTMARNCTISNIGEHGINLILFTVLVIVCVILSYALNGLFVKNKKSYERGVFLYALAFANIGYVGDPLALALFGDAGFSFYKLACLPLSIVIYVWGISVSKHIIVIDKPLYVQDFVKQGLNRYQIAEIFKDKVNDLYFKYVENAEVYDDKAEQKRLKAERKALKKASK